MTWIPTRYRRKFDLLNPRAEDVSIEDVAHALSNLCRFTGHSFRFYSVAQHSVLVSDAVHPRFALDALLHDAAEAYTGDCSTPMKQALNATGDAWKRVAYPINRAVAEAFGLKWPPPPEVDEADRRICNSEAWEFFGWPLENWTQSLPERLIAPIRPLSSEDARDLFLKRYAQLMTKINGKQARHLAGAAHSELN